MQITLIVMLFNYSYQVEYDKIQAALEGCFDHFNEDQAVSSFDELKGLYGAFYDTLGEPLKSGLQEIAKNNKSQESIDSQSESMMTDMLWVDELAKEMFQTIAVANLIGYADFTSGNPVSLLARQLQTMCRSLGLMTIVEDMVRSHYTDKYEDKKLMSVLLFTALSSNIAFILPDSTKPQAERYQEYKSSFSANWISFSSAFGQDNQVLIDFNQKLASGTYFLEETAKNLPSRREQ